VTKCHFGLGKKFVPVVDGERWMGRREDAEKMPFESLDTAFRGVRSFLVGWDVVMDHVLRREEIEKGSRSFVIEDLNFEMVAESTEEEVGREVSGAEMGSRARYKWFNLCRQRAIDIPYGSWRGRGIGLGDQKR
jgi:hypothetical protein